MLRTRPFNPVFLVLALFIAADTAFALYALRDPTDGGNVGGGLALFPLILLGLPWTGAYFFIGDVDEDSLFVQLYPLALGLLAATNLAIAWFWAHRARRA